MSSVTHCSECGAELPTGLLGNRCPRCVLQLGLEVAAGQPAPAGGTASPDRPPTPLSRVRQFGDYELLEEIARGGMGIVYKARQVSLNRYVAVKMILFGEFARPPIVQRFRREAEAAARLQHPNIVAVHEVGEHEGQQYFSMDYVEGPNLMRLVGHTPLPAKRAARYVQTLAEAIQYAHQHGVLHRDLKPSNVLIDPLDQPRITDFGLAKVLQSDTDLTLSGQALGSPNYTPPEQAAGWRDQVGPASDAYGLGAILYYLLTGRPPFVGETVDTTLAAVLNQEPVSPRSLHVGVPRDLETICLKCLEKDPRRRYPTAQELAEELGRFLRGQPVLARPIGPVGKVWRWCRRRPVRAGLIAALLGAIVLGSAGVLWQWQRAEQNAALQARERQRADAALVQLEIQRAEDLLAADRVPMGLAYLAGVVRLDPSNRVAAERLMSALGHRSFALAILPSLEHAAEVRCAVFSPNGQRLATAGSDGRVRVWDAATGQPVTDWFKHQGAVNTLVFSPDGYCVLTASVDKTARVWDAQTGQSLTPPLQHDAEVKSAEFSLDGQRIVSASFDKTARVWAARTGEPLGAPLRHRNELHHAMFSPDGRLVVTAGNDPRIWDWETSQVRVDRFPHQWTVASARFSPDGARVVTASGDSSARVWETATGLPMTEPLRHSAAVGAAEFSPDGQQVLTACWDKTARLWEARSGQPLVPPLRHEDRVTAAHFSPDGQWIVTSSADTTARVWEARTGQLLMPPLKHAAWVWSAQFSPDGRRVVTASADKTARLWEIRGSPPLAVLLPHRLAVFCPRFSPDGTRVVTASDDMTARVWDAASGRALTPPLYHKWGLTGVEFSPDGTRVATASLDMTARVWDAGSGRALTPPLYHRAHVAGVAFSPDGRLLVTFSGDKTARIWDAASRSAAVQTERRMPPPLRHSNDVVSAQFSPDSKRLVTASSDGTACIWDAQTGQLVASPLRHEYEVTSAQFSPDGLRVVTTSRDATARVWDARTAQPLAPPLKHDNYVMRAAFSPDGGRVVTASGDLTARIWDARTGQCLTEPLMHRSEVRDAQFSPDGRRIVTASLDGTARVWDAQTGQALTEPLRHDNEVWSARFSPDGHWIATASLDGTARIWEVSHGPVPVPAWLPGLAEAVAGQRLNAGRISELVGAGEFLRLKQELERRAPSDAYTRWAHWFLRDPLARTISPSSPVRVSDYVQRRIEQATVEGLREACRLSPSNATALARLAVQTSGAAGTNRLRELGEAEWLSRRALALGPETTEAWWVRAEILEQRSNLVDSLSALNRALEVLTNQFEAPRPGRAVSLLTSPLVHRQITLADCLGVNADPAWELETVQSALLLHRCRLFKQLHRLEAAAADNLRARSIAPRDPRAGPQVLDLSPYYNASLDESWQTGGHRHGVGNDLVTLPRGLQRFGGVEFDVRGIVQLSSTELRKYRLEYPQEMVGIPVGQKCQRLHFLQSAGWGERTSVPVGRYVAHYRDGQTQEVTLRYGEDLWEWWGGSVASLPDRTRVVWHGTNAYGKACRLFKNTWQNPRPDTEIKSIDFRSAMTSVAPFVVAITAE